MREELAALNVPIEGIKPGNDKYSRAHAVLPIAESGNVSVLRGPWTDDFLHELCSFPNAKRDDYVDSFTQCLDTMRGEIHWGCMTRL
jgi:predicted phage terminase large subunit-like protein